MTVIKARLSGELEHALERYRENHPDETSDEAVVQKALKRFLLEGFPPEDEPLNETELEALHRHTREESEYEAWRDVKKNL
jgi:hypothetical protein